MITRRDDAPAIRVRDLTVRYGSVTALHDVSLNLEFGQVAGLIGMNGSGKSTLFKSIMGQLPTVSGEVSIAAGDAGIAYVPQSEAVDWNFPLSVEQVVMTGRYGHMNILRRPSSADHEAVAHALERTQLTDLRDRQIGQLSGGQRKRVFVARGLAQQARIMLLDEPFAGVDAVSEATISRLLRELATDGRLVFISTHDLAAVPRLCDTVTMLNRTIIAQGDPRTVMDNDTLIRTFGSDPTRAAAPETPQEAPHVDMAD